MISSISSASTLQYSADKRLPQNQPPRVQQVSQPVSRIQAQGISTSPFSLGLPQQLATITTASWVTSTLSAYRQNNVYYSGN